MAVDLAALRARATRYFERDIWQRPASGDEPIWQRAGRSALQVLVVVVQGIARDQILLRASALTYFAMLSLIPILALAIGLVGAFGASDELARAVIARIAVATPDVGDTILELVHKVNFRSLGTYGGAGLFVTTVIALGSVERAFNAIWGIGRERAPIRRFADYLAVLVIAPLIFTVALSTATGLRSETVLARILAHPALAQAYELGLRQVPTLLLWLGFGFLYWFLPNTSVRVVPALLGGLVAAVAFAIAQAAYLGLNIGVARANAVFGSFAALPLLLGWLYASWVVVLLGCEVAFAAQNLATFRAARDGEEPRAAAREAIGIAVAVRVARAFRAGEDVAAEEIANALDVPVRTVRALLADLEAGGVVAERGGDKVDRYQLGRAAEALPMTQVLEALRGKPGMPGPTRAGDAPVRALVGEIEQGVSDALRARTLADLLAAAPEVDPPQRHA